MPFFSHRLDSNDDWISSAYFKMMTMEKQIVCAELNGDTTPPFLWADFKNGSENIKGYLNGLGCVMEEVVIVSTGNNFSVLGISSGADPLLLFFKSFHLENYLRISQTTSESINYLLEGIKAKNKFGPSHLKKAFRLAQEERSLGPGFSYLSELLFGKSIPNDAGQELVKNVQKIINRSFVCL